MDGYPRWTRTVAPTQLAVAVDDLKDEIGIPDDTSQDARLARLIAEATNQIEEDARLVVMTQTWVGYLDQFPCGRDIRLTQWPVQSLSYVKYVTGGVLTTISSSLYETDFISAPGRLRPVFGKSWPVPDNAANAVQLAVVAGYASAAVVPDYLRSVIIQVARAKYFGCDLDGVYDVLIERLQRFGFVR